MGTILRGAKRAAENLRRGLEDAVRLDRSFSLVWRYVPHQAVITRADVAYSDAELRVLVLKST